MTLDEIKIGRRARVVDILHTDLKRRFLEIGLVPGSSVMCVIESPFKNPRAYFVMNSLISIRNNDAKSVVVEYEED